MDIRRLLGLALAGFAGYQLWGKVHAAQVYAERAGVNPLLDPAFSLPMAGAGLVLVGGALIALNRRKVTWIALLGTLIYGLFVLAMAGLGANSTVWGDEAVETLVMAGLAIAVLIVGRRQPATKG
jgi:hypothetical protein